MNKLSPATLIIGTPENTRTYAHNLIKQTLCKSSGCSTCAICRMDHIVQHHHILWLKPEKKYTLDFLEPISHKIDFVLEDDEHFFFVLEKADFLTPACANSLLKMVEEPPQGYHFLFLATQPQLVISTIRSRCHTLYTTATPRATSSGFLRHFMGHVTTPALFIKELQTDCPEDYETPECLDILLTHWSENYKTHLATTQSREAHYARAIITLLQEATQHSPMPGSAKIFWRDLFLRKDCIPS